MALAELRHNAVERRNFLAPSNRLDDQRFEFIFTLDTSGSMQSDKIILAKNALALFLRSLPTTCIFNVISFNSGYNKMRPESVQYTQENLQAALKFSEGLGAGGGTNLTAPLTDIYGTRQTPGYLTQVFILTDGQTDNPAADMSLVENNKSFARIFTLGIGKRSIDPEFLKTMAANGGGMAEFVSDSYEEIRTKILNQLKIALKPSLLKAIPIEFAN